MNINEFTELSKNIEVPEIVINRFEDTIKIIKSSDGKEENGKKIYKWSSMNMMTRVAAVMITVLLFTVTGLSARAYLSNILRIKNTSDEEVVSLYENVFKNFKGMFSRELSEDELVLERKCFDRYINDQASPEGQIAIIEKKSEYKGKGVAYCKEDGILYLPQKKLSEEEMLECIEFSQFSRYIDYERYRTATDPDYYLNDLRNLSSAEVDEIYVTYYGAGTDATFFSRELTDSEKILLRNYRKLYKYADKKPEKTIQILNEESEYEGTGVAFCRTNGFFYVPATELTEEEALEILDLDIKAEYCLRRIDEEINDGLRAERPYIKPVYRERTITIDQNMQADADLMNLPWIKAYSDVIDKEFSKIKNMWLDDASSYYANVCFIYLNDDDIPEMLFNTALTDMDYDDRCNYRDIIYTYQNGTAVKLNANDSEIRDLYNYLGKFKYAERKGMVYYDSCYEYAIFTLKVGEDEEDVSNHNLTRVDTWNSDLTSCVQSKSNLYIEHCITDKNDLNLNHALDNARFEDEYFINVEGVDTGVRPNVIYGDKVSKAEYEKANEALWGGNEYITLEVSDFDKIYLEDNVLESLVKVYMKKLN